MSATACGLEFVFPAGECLFGAMDQLATYWVLGKREYRLINRAPANAISEQLVTEVNAALNSV